MQDSQAIEIVAHRGAGKDFTRPEPGLAHRPAAPPENTLPALEQGWKGGRACEIDVRLTRDRRLVVHHDATTGRTCDRNLTVLREDLAALRRLDAGIRKGHVWRGVRIPTLGEALATIPEGGRLYVEVKDGPGAVPPLVKSIEAAGRGAGQIVFLSFVLATVAEIKRRLPGFGAYWVLKLARPLPGLWWYRQSRALADGLTTRRVWRPLNARRILADVDRHGLDGLDLSCRHPTGLTEALNDRGVPWGAWNVDAADAAVALARQGAIQLTTNLPTDLKTALTRAGIPTM